MQVHFVAIEIGIERRAAAFVEAKRAMWLDDGIERHYAQLVETRLSIE